MNVACDRLVNLYPEMGGPGQGVAALYGTPGCRPILTTGTPLSGTVRGLHVMGDYLYVVAGTDLWQINSAWHVVAFVPAYGTGPVSIADNGAQIFFAFNPEAVVWDVEMGVVSRIIDPDFPGAVTVDYIDGYFVFNEPDSDRFWATQIENGFDIDALDYASAEGNPDNLRSLLVDHREIWLFGENSVEVWYNSGAADFPFERLSGAVLEQGCAAAYSPAQCDNTVFWLGSDDRGAGTVWRAQGYTPVRVSTNAVERALQGYSTIEDAIGFGYQQEGHFFYVLSFPTANATWVFDASTGMWHERAYMNQSTGALGRWLANCHVFFQGRHVVGDYRANGALYELDLGWYRDGTGDEIKAIRAWRALPLEQNDTLRTLQHSLQLLGESGVGLEFGLGSAPKAMLRWSDDGGHTWSNEHWRSLGAIGEYGCRVIWRRLGSTEKLRDRVFEVTVTDPVKRAWTGAELMLSGSAS